MITIGSTELLLNILQICVGVALLTFLIVKWKKQ